MFSKSVMLAAVGAALLVTASAKAVTLDTLTGTNFGGQIMAGNMVYSNFTYGSTTVPASSILVTTTATGLEFSTTGGWTNTANNSVISYDVNMSGSTIQSVNLGFSATASGNAVASVGETITDNNSTATPKTQYSLQVTASGSSALSGSDKSTDSVSLTPPTSSLHIVKSIDIAGSGTATITLVDNNYIATTGSPPPVPEPMTLALLPLAIAGLGLRKKFSR